MRTSLRHTLAATILVAAIPVGASSAAAAPASAAKATAGASASVKPGETSDAKGKDRAGAHGKSKSGAKGKSGAKSKGKPAKTKKSRAKQRCQRGKTYVIGGVLDEQSTITQVAGANTKRRSDDRYSGTLVIDVDTGNKLGRRDIGLTSYVLSGVPLRGITASGMPEAGTEVNLTGIQAPAGCVKQLRPKAPRPTDDTDDEYVDDTEEESEDESAEAWRLEYEDEDYDEDYEEDEDWEDDEEEYEEPVAINDVRVTSVRFLR